jgi:hypothetical protein
MQDHLPISAIKCHPFLQQRSPHLIDDKYDLNRQVANLSSTITTVKSDLNNGQKIRVPLDVHEVNNEYLLVDGHHRYHGALAHCKETKTDHNLLQVPVNIIKDSTLQAAIDASFKVNLDHGVSLTSAERKHLHFRRYVWDRSVPMIKEIMAEASCAKGTASYIAKAAKWCINEIQSNGIKTVSPPELRAFMVKKMVDLGITSEYLDEYGLPSYSLVIKALKGDQFDDIEINGSREEDIQTVRYQLESLEAQYGADILREGLKKYKTPAHGITISRRTLWLSLDTTASLLVVLSDPSEDF